MIAAIVGNALKIPMKLFKITAGQLSETLFGQTYGRGYESLKRDASHWNVCTYLL